MISNFQNMSIAPKLSYHHSIFPIGFKIPLIIKCKHLDTTYNRNVLYIEPNIHGIYIEDIPFNILPLINFKDNEFITWSVYFNKHNYTTDHTQFMICCKLDNLYGCKYTTHFLSKWNKHILIRLCFTEAATNGCIKIMKYLVFLGSNIRFYYNDSLCRASQNGHLDTVRYLVSLGADITFYHNLALREAAENGHFGIVRYLVSLGADITVKCNEPVRNAASNGHIDTVRYLVSLGADITDDDNCAIRLSTGFGHLYMVRYLITKGADVTANNNEALFFASEFDHFDIIPYLIAQGAFYQQNKHKL